tara:strand:+ start:318 stop:536 length:219 start_codon:yes stop_codon:yes gene_type:complete
MNYKKNKSMDFCRSGAMKDYGKVLKDPKGEKKKDTRSTLGKVKDAAKAFAYGSTHSITRGVKNAVSAYKGNK